MRTFIKTISLSFIMIAISCSKEVAEPNANQNNNPDRTSYSISIDDLHAYLTEQSTTVLTRGSSFDIQPITSEKDTVLYMVNYEDGWEVFSADKRAPRVFAKAETGSISESDFKEIPALKCDDYWFSTDALNWFANGTVFNDIFCMIYIVSI